VHGRHTIHPSYWSADLKNQIRDDFGGFLVGARVYVLEHRERWNFEFDRSKGLL
jgi:hypothetical protein